MTESHRATEPIATLSLTAIDCPDPEALAAFYATITGWAVEPDGDESDWVQLRSDCAVTLAFQRVAEYRPPQWPGQEHPQQLHLDFDVADLDIGQEQVLALGARLATEQPGTTFRVFLDPAGHPFCLVLAG